MSTQRSSRRSSRSAFTPTRKCGENASASTNNNDVQLFALNAGVDDTTSNSNGSGRPVRKLKAIERFDPLSFDTKQKTHNCKVGEGFPCPRCSYVCSYDSRICNGCRLECYYEAGFGVVTLKDRASNNDNSSNKGHNADGRNERSKRRRTYRQSRRSDILEEQILPREEPQASGNQLMNDASDGDNTNNIEHDDDNDDSDDAIAIIDEQLPAELRGLDKELVSHINNEIINAGEQISFDNIAGLEYAKQAVRSMLVYPMRRPDLFTGLRGPDRGLLLFGPPGTGKTLIGKAIAHECGATFFSIRSSSLTSKWAGEGEKLVRTLFAVASHRAPSVVFFDEVDSLLSTRRPDESEAIRRIKAELLVQLDGAGNERKGHVLFVGTTNLPWQLDAAARRRFEERLYIPLPTPKAREALIHILLKKNEHCLSNAQIQKLSNDTFGYSGADLEMLCKKAAKCPIRGLAGTRLRDMTERDFPAISYGHFRDSLKRAKPSVAQSELAAYEEWNDMFGDGENDFAMNKG